MPIFTTKKMTGYAELTKKLTNDLLQSWADKESFDLYLEMKKLVTLFASEVVLGLKDPTKTFELSDTMEEWYHLNISASARFL